MTPGVDIVAATLNYHQHLLFHQLNFTLPGGQWTCLLGQSGVGKSSLLRLIAGLETNATSSLVRASDDLPLAGRVGYLAQQDSLLPWLSVVDNVLIGARLRGQVCDQERARMLLHQVGLHHVAEASPSTLSGGMQQRALLARVLFEDKPIILLDEPFSALDAITRTRLQTLSAELLQGRTVLLVTHDPLEALRLGHRVHIMSGQPARLSDPIVPQNSPPRSLSDPALLALQGEILQQLASLPEEMA